MSIFSKMSRGDKIALGICSSLAVFLIIILIIIKLNSPSFALGSFILYTLLIIGFFAGVIVAYHFITKKKVTTTEKVDSKLPAAITLEQARELCKMQLENPLYCDYMDGAHKETNELLGKNIKSWVYSLTTLGAYKNGEEKPDTYVIIMNRHFPENTLTILINPTQAEINHYKAFAAFQPEESPTIEVVERRNPLLGTEEKITKTTPKEEEKENKKEKDL